MSTTVRVNGTVQFTLSTYWTGPSNKIFVRILFALIVATLFLLNWLFYYLVMSECMTTPVRVNGTFQLILSTYSTGRVISSLSE